MRKIEKSIKSIAVLMPTATRDVATQPQRHISIAAQNALALYGNKEQFELIYSPSKQYVVAENVRQYLMNAIAPTLRLVSEMYSKNYCLAWVMRQINALNYLNGKEKFKMSNDAVVDTSMTIVSQYSMLRVTDIMLFIQQFKSGMYGVIYGALDGIQITNGLYQYQEWKESKRKEFMALAQAEESQVKEEYERYAVPLTTIVSGIYGGGRYEIPLKPSVQTWLRSEAFNNAFARLSTEEADIKREAIVRAFNLDLDDSANFEHRTIDVARVSFQSIKDAVKWYFATFKTPLHYFAPFPFDLNNAEDLKKCVIAKLLYELHFGEQAHWVRQYEHVADWLIDNDGKGLLMYNAKSALIVAIKNSIAMLYQGCATDSIIFKAANMKQYLREMLQTFMLFIEDNGKEPDSMLQELQTIVENREKQGGLLIIQTAQSRTEFLSKYGEDLTTRIERLCKRIDFNQ